MTTNGGAAKALRISQVTDNQTVAYAASELAKYLTSMTNLEIASGTGGIRLGLISDFPELSAPTVDDPAMDDAIDLDVNGGEGYIAGINPRSVLLAVYRYLGELGCRWVRPGTSGEYIPTLGALPHVRLHETPSYRHRGLCIEGAVSYEHVRDSLEWMPKVGFNSFFIQFRESHTFFDRWYSRADNPLIETEVFTAQQSREIIAALAGDMEKRGILYHGVGHGWTCEPFGISCLGWEKLNEEPSGDVRQYLAMVNGERKFWKGVPLDTNLCYGNPKVRRLIIEDIANYAEIHPEMDMIHFWLADGMNNHCECELCRDTRPSDLYVTMLNELDSLLTERKLSTKIVMLIYVDLLWPPVKEKIANQERFILMFAPITRTYSSTFKTSGPLPEISDYQRNKLEMPAGVDLNIAFLSAWQKLFSGDSFDFDYHMTWEHFNDPGYMQISNTIAEDVKALKDIDLNGLISCQTERAFFPTGLPMVAMGRTLWNSALRFDDIAADYFKSAFGPDWELCRAYLTLLGELFDPVYLRSEKPIVSTEAAERLAKIPAMIQSFAEVIERNIGSENPCWKQSWTYLKYHAEICTAMVPAFTARAMDDEALALSRCKELIELVWKLEPEIHEVMDVWVFAEQWLRFGKFNLPEKK